MSSAPPSGATVSYRQQYRRCGKPSCARCSAGGRGHGPYWYAVWWDGVRTRSQYLGKAPPTHVPGPADTAVADEDSAPPRPAGGTHRELTSVVALCVQTLGDFAVWRGGSPLPVADWGRRRTGTLFKWLLAAPGHRLTRDQALELLWPEAAPEAAATNMRVLVHRLRRALGDLPEEAASLLQYDGRTLALAPTLKGMDWLDADAFARAAARAMASRDRAACRAALDLYRGEYLPEDAYEEWALRRREELRSLHLKLLLHLASCTERAGEMEEAASCFQAALVADPCCEEAAVGLMRMKVAAEQPAAALRVYHRLADALREELNLAPGEEARALARTLLARQPKAQPAAVSSVPNNLPAVLTNFIGRGRDLAVLAALVAPSAAGRAPCRLLTLVGPGGVGKTRLSLALAGESLEQYPHGIWLVDLAGLPGSADGDDPAVARAVARVLAVEETPGRSLAALLIDALRHRRVLLVLDNCEHVLPACASLAASLLAACPSLQILATSRETLGVAGEQPWAVPALSLPPARAGLEQLAEAASVRLFLARARVQRPGLELTAENAAAVASICRELDGLPLALELAAARVGALSVGEIAEKLHESLRLLTGGARNAPQRQRTLQATLDWSYGLLTSAEQALLRHLAVFKGGCTVEAVQATARTPGVQDGVAAHDGESVQWVVLDSLDGLVRKSLLLCEEQQGAARYRLLETVRQYAAMRLAAAGETAAAQDEHLLYYLGLAEEAEGALRGPQQATWLARLDREHDNLRAALRWAVESSQPLLGLRLAAALGRFWHLHGHLSEGQRRLEVALAQEVPSSGREATADEARLRGMALRAAGVLASDQGDYARATAWYHEGLALLREVGDTRNMALILNNLGNVVGWQGDVAGARAFYEESLSLLRTVGDTVLIAAVLGSLGSLACEQGDAEQAIPFLEESLVLQRELGDQDGSARTLTNLALAAHIQGDRARAVALYEEGLAIKRAIGSKSSIAYSLSNLAAVLRELDDVRRATELQSEGLALMREVNDRLGMALSLEGMAHIAHALGDSMRAVRLFAAAQAARQQIGAPQLGAERQAHDATLVILRASLGDAAFARAWDGGRALSLAEAIAEALSPGGPTYGDPGTDYAIDGSLSDVRTG